MKKLFGILIMLTQPQAYANMANPVIGGTLGGRPFVSQFVDVVREDLLITVGKKFEYASFNVKYHINSSKDGFQIPFLFYASEYLDSFSVRIDGKEVAIQDIPNDFKVPENTKFKDFSYFFEKHEYSDFHDVLVEDAPNSGFFIRLGDMIYFEADISKGAHVIEVSYRATKWTDKSGWVKNYSFRYALSPAKYWKSFGTLHITVDASGFEQELTTNLGQPNSGDINSKAHWEFDMLPTEILQIVYTPKISNTAQTLIRIGPDGLAYITGGIMFILHLLTLIGYRKRVPERRFSIIVIIGSILVPLVFVISWMVYYVLIDSFIGEHAGVHGYTFMVLVLYPVILPFYWLIIWLVDKQFKKQYTLQQKL